MVLTHRISPDSAAAPIYSLKPPYVTVSSQSRNYRVITHLRTDGVHCREFAGTGPVVLKVVRVTGTTALAGLTMDQLMHASLFPHPLLV